MGYPERVQKWASENAVKCAILRANNNNKNSSTGKLEIDKQSSKHETEKKRNKKS